MTTAMSFGTFLNLFRKAHEGSTESIGQLLQLARPDLRRLANRFLSQRHFAEYRSSIDLHGSIQHAIDHLEGARE